MNLRKQIEEQVRTAAGIEDMDADQAVDVAQAVLLAVRTHLEKHEPKAVVTINHLKEADDFVAICLNDEE